MNAILWFTFGIGLMTIVAFWMFGFHALTYGSMYEWTVKFQDQIDTQTDKWWMILGYFILRAAGAIVGVIAYTFDGEYRYVVAQNRADWKLNVRFDQKWKFKFMERTEMMLRALKTAPDNSAETLVTTVFGPNWHKTDLEDYSAENNQPVPIKEREEIRDWLAEINAVVPSEEKLEEALESPHDWPSWINKPSVSEPEEDLVVLLEDEKPEEKPAEIVVPAATAEPIAPKETSLDDVAKALKGIGRRLSRLEAKKKVQKKPARRAKPKAKRKVTKRKVIKKKRR